MQNQKPLISVIVPVYNAEKDLSVCLDSICNQTLRELEIIVVDDGSTDRSGQIADQYTEKDDRIQVIHQKNVHLRASRNNGMSVAKGDFISFIDADDWIEKDMLQSMYNVITSKALDVLVIGVCVEYPKENRFCNQKIATYTEARSKEERKHIFFQLKKVCLFNYSWNKLYRTSFLRTNNLHFEVEAPCEDEAFSMEVFMKASAIGALPDIFYHYMRTENPSILTSYKTNLLEVYEERCKVCNRFFTYLQMPSEWIDNYFRDDWWKKYRGYVMNLYKWNSPLSRRERLDLINVHIYQNVALQKLILGVHPQDRVEKIFRLLVRYGSSWQIDLMYSFLFSMRYHLVFLYRYYRRYKMNKK